MAQSSTTALVAPNRRRRLSDRKLNATHPITPLNVGGFAPRPMLAPRTESVNSQLLGRGSWRGVDLSMGRALCVALTHLDSPYDPAPEPPEAPPNLYGSPMAAGAVPLYTRVATPPFAPKDRVAAAEARLAAAAAEGKHSAIQAAKQEVNFAKADAERETRRPRRKTETFTSIRGGKLSNLKQQQVDNCPSAASSRHRTSSTSTVYGRVNGLPFLHKLVIPQLSSQTTCQVTGSWSGVVKLGQVSLTDEQDGETSKKQLRAMFPSIKYPSMKSTRPMVLPDKHAEHQRCLAVIMYSPDGVLGNDPKAHAWALSCISEHMTATTAIVETGGVHICFGNLTTEYTLSDDTEKNGNWVLACISDFEPHGRAIMSGDGIQTLLKILPDLQRDVQLNVASALACISSRLNAAAVASIATLLVRALQGEANEEIQATLALTRILRHPQHVDTVVAAGAVSALFRVIGKGNTSWNHRLIISQMLDLDLSSTARSEGTQCAKTYASNALDMIAERGRRSSGNPGVDAKKTAITRAETQMPEEPTSQANKGKLSNRDDDDHSRTHSELLLAPSAPLDRIIKAPFPPSSPPDNCSPRRPLGDSDYISSEDCDTDFVSKLYLA